jgi:hypothetical protein
MVNPESNIEALRKQAAGFRRLAREIVDGDFRRRLLDLAADSDTPRCDWHRRWLGCRADRVVRQDGGEPIGIS